MRDTGRNRNTNDGAAVSEPISVGSVASTVLAGANPERMYFHAGVIGQIAPVFIKLQEAGTDNDKKGIFLGGINRSESSWEMPPDNIYTGEISAIADSGDVDVCVTEY